MSFLSSFLCCFEPDSSSRHQNNHRREGQHIQYRTISNHSNQRLSKTQSNLQRALTPSPTNKSHPPSGIPSSLKNSSLVDPYKNTKSSPYNMDSHQQKTMYSNINPLSSGKTLAKNSTNNNNNIGNAINNTKIVNGNAKMIDANNTAKMSTPPEYKELVEEIADSKESTESSKNDDDDIVRIHDNQTASTDEMEKPPYNSHNDSGNNTTNNNNNTNTNTNTGNYTDHNPTSEMANNIHNPISTYDPNNPLNSQINNQSFYDDQFGLDLTEILPDQTVSSTGWLLGPQPEKLKGKKCLILDLDETLVHSSFKYVRQCDFVIPVDIENQIHNVYVIKRPGVDKFLERVGQLFEVVVFTASVARYGDPLLDILDPHKTIHHRLFRDSCYNYQGNYIKNLSQMGRPLEDLIIIDNSPASYVFHPHHAVPISSWFSDSHDCELTDLLPFLEDLASSNVDDIRLVLDITL